MSSIALFPCMPTLDSGIIGELSRIFTLKVYTDQNLFGETAARFGADSQRLKKMMFGRTSVFNQFTLEKEDVVNMFFQVLADKLCDPEQYLFHGFLTSLIPPKRKEFLRVVVIDTCLLLKTWQQISSLLNAQLPKKYLNAVSWSGRPTIRYPMPGFISSSNFRTGSNLWKT